MSLTGALWDPIFRPVAVFGPTLEEQGVAALRWRVRHAEAERSPAGRDPRWTGQIAGPL